MALADGFWLGVLGGFLAEIVSLFKLRYLPREALPVWLSSIWYWIVTLAMIVSGGALVTIYLGSGVTMTPLLAVNIGASAPLILQSLAAQAPPTSPGIVN